MTTNRTVLDLSKVQHGSLYWESGCLRRSRKPQYPTYHGEPIREGLAAHLDAFPGETMLERATRRGLLDVWRPVVVFQLTANHKLSYTGDKALSMWKAWQARIFSLAK